MRIQTFFAIALFASAAMAGTDLYTAELDALAANDDLNDLIVRVNNPRSPDEFRLGLAWLQEKSISGFGGARIHYSYAYGLYGANIRETATFAYLLGLLTGRVDAARCKDPSAPGEKLQAWERTLAPIIENWSKLPSNKRKEMISLAVKVEDKNRTRAPDSWLCNGGLAYFHRYLEKHKQDTLPNPSEMQKSGHPESSTLLEDPEIKPEFVTLEEWQLRRKKLITAFVSQFSNAK